MMLAQKWLQREQAIKKFSFLQKKGEFQLIDNGFESPDDFMFGEEIYSYAKSYFEGTKSEIKEKVYVLS